MDKDCLSIDVIRFIGFRLCLFYMNKRVEPFLLLALERLEFRVELIE